MRHILFFIDSLNCGGAEKSITSLLQLLDYSKYSVDLLLFSRGGIFEKYIPREVNILSFREFYPRGIKELINQLAYSLRLRIGKNGHSAELRWKVFGKCYRSFPKQYDVAIAYQQGFPSYFIASYVTATKKIAWINADLKKAGYSPKFNQTFYKKYDNIVAVSENLKQLIADYTDISKVCVIQDITNPQQIKEMAKEPCFFKQNINITTVGRLAPPKGYNLAIEAASILKERNIDFTWHFVGDGPLRKDLERSIASKGLNSYITLEGEQGNPYPYIQNADIYVQPSLFEGFGITVAEAKILCKPIISTNFPVVYNQLTDGVDSLIVEMDAKQIADAIIRLINEPDTCRLFSERLSSCPSTSHLTEASKVMKIIDSAL